GVECWGENAYGVVGDGTTTDRLTPVAVSGLSSGVAEVSVGYYHACALTTVGGVRCWGENSRGELGDGTTATRLSPVAVSGLTSGITSIATGLDHAHHDHTCAVTTTGGVKCWGDNQFGELGDGTTTDRSTPVDVSGLTSGVVAVYAGGTATCAVTTGGGAKCWGNNDAGQLGDGTTTNRSTPVDVSGLGSGVSTIAMSQSSAGEGIGGSHTCAVTTSGAARCWGNDADAQLGDGATGTNRTTPVGVAGLTSGMVGVAVNFWDGCAMASSGAVRCWGSSEVGDGTSKQRLTPVDVSGSFFRPECPDLIAQDHTGFTLSDGYAVGSTATFSADPGFDLAGPATTACLSDLTWSDPPPGVVLGPVTLAVAPSTDLSGGQTVSVSVGGVVPGHTAGWCQGVPAVGPPSTAFCGANTTYTQVASASGTISGTARLERFIFVPALSRWVDCAAAGEQCSVGAADAADVASTPASSLLTFAPPPPPPTTRGSIQVQATQTADIVQGSGFRPGANIDVYECVTGATDPSACGFAKATTTADSSGAMSATVSPDLTVTPAGGGSTSCTPYTSEACSIVVAESVDFPGTQVSVPLPAPPPAVPRVVPGSVAVAEGDTATTSVQVPVTLSEATSATVTVSWTTLFASGAPGNQADPTSDYTPGSGTVTFAPGETSKTVTVVIDGDTVVEPDEYVVVSFQHPTNATMGGFWGLGFGVITNDDHATVVPGVASALEGDAGTTTVEVPVTLSNPSTQTVTVEWNTLFASGAPGDQADPATDYLPVSGTVTFAPGETTKTVTVVIDGDTVVEPDEYVVVSFHHPTNATMGGFWGLGFGVITNDD
ncbi:MAG: Calx-beta domain-containing protein, partial [Acidimicrobiales bacterium]